MSNAFHIFDPKATTFSGSTQERDDKILPDPVLLGDTDVIIDGKQVTVTATSGTYQYSIVFPHDYPTSEDERQLRRGSDR